MARAEIYLEDNTGAPGAAARFLFVGGFDASSPSHQLCNILRKHLDGLAERGELQALEGRPATEAEAGVNDPDATLPGMTLVP